MMGPSRDCRLHLLRLENKSLLFPCMLSDRDFAGVLRHPRSSAHEVSNDDWLIRRLFHYRQSPGYHFVGIPFNM
jgi:hypothetical protein